MVAENINEKNPYNLMVSAFLKSAIVTAPSISPSKGFRNEKLDLPASGASDDGR